MSNSVRIEVIEEGNPRSTESIYKDGSAFVIEPYSEDGDPIYKFRLDVQLINDSDEPVPTRVVVDWKDTSPEHMMNRTYMLLCTGDDTWTCFDARVSGSRVSALLPIPAGVSRLAMHPPYEFRRLTELLQSLPSDHLTVRSIGKSVSGRDVYAVEAGNPSAPAFALTTRVHPYETIGSWWVEGMITWLAEADREAQRLLAERRILLLPMMNPDGVAEGTCKRTLGGLNFSVDFGDSTEPEAVALKEYLSGHKIKAIYDLHGWMNDYHGIKSNDLARAEAIKGQWEARPDLFDREIRAEHRETFAQGKHTAAYFKEKHGAVFFINSSPWYDRTAEELRQMGVTVLKSYLSQF